jgi:hypothetical protein
MQWPAQRVGARRGVVVRRHRHRGPPSRCVMARIASGSATDGSQPWRSTLRSSGLAWFRQRARNGRGALTRLGSRSWCSSHAGGRRPQRYNSTSGRPSNSSRRAEKPDAAAGQDRRVDPVLRVRRADVAGEVPSRGGATRGPAGVDPRVRPRRARPSLIRAQGAGSRGRGGSAGCAVRARSCRAGRPRRRAPRRPRIAALPRRSRRSSIRRLSVDKLAWQNGRREALTSRRPAHSSRVSTQAAGSWRSSSASPPATMPVQRRCSTR